MTNLNQCTNFKKILSLLDTGSQTSFICQSVLPKNLPVGTLVDTGYIGIGHKRIYSYGKIFCILKILNEIKLVNFYVVPKDLLSSPILIGRNILKLFSV